MAESEFEYNVQDELDDVAARLYAVSEEIAKLAELVDDALMQIEEEGDE